MSPTFPFSVISDYYGTKIRIQLLRLLSVQGEIAICFNSRLISKFVGKKITDPKISKLFKGFLCCFYLARYISFLHSICFSFTKINTTKG